MARALFALAVVLALLGAVAAYAATRPEGRHAGLAGQQTVKVSPRSSPSQGAGAATDGPKQEERLLRPRFIEYPDAATTVAEPQFRFHVAPRPTRPGPSLPGPPGEPAPPRRFQCRLDGGGWSVCSSPQRLAALAPGGHSFAVRAFNREGRPGPVVSHSWQLLERSPAREAEPADPQPFSIELQAEPLGDLYPGHPAQQLPIRIDNPNPVPIEVTGLSVAMVGDPSGCAAENFELIPSSASPSAPLTVPAGSSVSLPSATISAPSIAMLNLPVNQDACRGAEIPLSFSGEARG